MNPKTSSNQDESDDYLPEIDVNQLVVWNQKRRKVCGFLNKKGGSSGASGLFGNRRNWQKRFFILEHRLTGPDDNYLLKYFKNPDDSKPKGVLPLDGAEILDDPDITKSKRKQDYAFQIKVPERKDPFEVTATTEREKQMWMQTLKYVANCASRRGSLQRQRMGQRMNARASFYVEVRRFFCQREKH